MSGSRIPYFDFYPTDFMRGVRGLTPTEVGIYTMILCRIYEENGPIEYHPIRLSAYCGTRESVLTKAVDRLIVLGRIEVQDGMLSDPDMRQVGFRGDAVRKPIPANVRGDVMAEGACAYCGRKEGPFEIDHIMPWSRGGSDSRENLTLACRPCNRSKRDMTPEEWLQ